MSGIYLITCLSNDMKYVGSSVSIKKRINSHKRDLYFHLHSNPFLQKYWDEFGSDSFKFDILEECANKDLFQREVFWITELKTIDIRYGCNLTVPQEDEWLKSNTSYKLYLSEIRKGKMPSNFKEMNAKQKRKVDFFINNVYQATFESQKEAERQTGVKSGTINSSCANKTICRKPFLGYSFRYINNEEVRKIEFNEASNWRKNGRKNKL